MASIPGGASPDSSAPSTPTKGKKGEAEPDFSDDIKSPTNAVLHHLHDVKDAKEHPKDEKSKVKDPKDEAEEFKKRGNDFFQSKQRPNCLQVVGALLITSPASPSPTLVRCIDHKFAAAIDEYTKAIEKNGKDPVYWANRAFCHLKLEEYGSAVEDATTAINLNPKYVKVPHLSGQPPS
jgi:tetratricopeptide (TPR) repeat protein